MNAERVAIAFAAAFSLAMLAFLVWGVMEPGFYQ